jgi:phage/plasmid-like protein (TIGR03299 family)
MVAAVTVRKNGFAEMAYVGETPWHGLGQELQAGADLEVWKQAAGMDWTIQRGVVRYATSRGEDLGLHDIPESHVLFRSDSKAALGIVSKKYKVVQPGEVLEFFRDLTDANGYTLNTAGTLFDGKRFWALAAIGEEACVVGEDKIGGYLLLSSSCDGTLATTARFTTIRVVCNNTLSMALTGKAEREVVVRHTSHFNANEVKSQLGLARGHFGDFLKAARVLAAKSMSNEKAEDFTDALLKDTGTVLGEDVRKSKQFQKIMDLFKGSAMGGTLVSAEGSAWGLVNSVTEFVDHHARAKTDSHRIASAWYGRGDSLKTEALERALAL